MEGLQVCATAAMSSCTVADNITDIMFLACFSALLYLNNEFEGGDFFFAHSTKDLSPEVSIHVVLNLI